MQDAGTRSLVRRSTSQRSGAQNLTCVSLTVYAMICFVAQAQAADGCSTLKSAAESQSYVAGLAAFTAGHVEDGYIQLKAAYLDCSSNSRYRNDYIVAAASAGHASEAIAIASSLNASLLPTYVLESLGHAARDIHQPDLAIRYYDTILAVRIDVAARVGRDLALIDRGSANEAQIDLVALKAAYPDRVDVLEALGLADEALGDTIGALAAAEVLLEREPLHIGGLRLRYRTLLGAGAAHLATAVTPQQLLASKESGKGLRDQLAFEYRWARDDPNSDLVRARRLDEVIVRIRLAVGDPSSDREVQNGLRGDLVEALDERGRFREAIQEYEGLVTDGVVIAPDATGAAVDAYESTKQSKRAAALFLTLPAGATPAYGVKASYFYALLESGRYDAAIGWADAIAATEPKYFYANFPGLRMENPSYPKALVLASLARSYTDRLADGEQRLETVLNLAPANQDTRLALAESDELRGWPRRAASASDLLLQEGPDATGPLPQLFSDQVAMGDWHAADATLSRMNAALPADNLQLMRAERDWDTHRMAAVSVDGQLGRSYGGRSGVIDSEIGEYVYSSPLDWDYRAYLHLDQTEGLPVQGTTYRHAIGAGFEYHTRDWLATAELLVIDRSGPYPQFSVEATPNDYWRLGGSYALRTLDIPIAAVVVGVHADRGAVNVDYRVSESRELGAQAIHEQFSDSNSRSELLGYWRERWITGPIYKLDTRVDLDTSHNTLANTNYFNPKSDVSGTFTFQNQWLQFRRNDSSLTHTVDMGIGDYFEQGYGQGAIALVRYQAVCEVNGRLSFKAGAGTGIRPFDGRREHLDVLTFNVEGRFDAPSQTPAH